MVEGSERKFAESDREGQQGFVPSEELRRLEDRIQVADRVLLFADRPLSIEIDDGGEDRLQGNVGFERMSYGFLRRRRLVSEARFQSGHDRRGLPMPGPAEPPRLGRPETGRRDP